MGSRSRDRGGGECWGPGGRTFVTRFAILTAVHHAGRLNMPNAHIESVVQRHNDCGCYRTESQSGRSTNIDSHSRDKGFKT